MKIDIDPKGDLFKWGPIDGKLVYIDYFHIGFVKFPEFFYSWPDIIETFFNEKIADIIEYQPLRESGKKNFNKFILNDKNFNKYYKLWRKHIKDLLEIQKEITVENLKTLSNSEVRKLYEKWSTTYIDFWTIGELPEVANWGGEQILKEKLEKLVPAEDFIYAFERLSAPEDLSFYQKADLDLLKLRKFFKNKELFNKKLGQYQQNYFWILNSYHHTKILSKSYFEKQLLAYSQAEAQKKLKELEALPKKTKFEKQKVIKKYKLGKDMAKISERLAFCIWWQDLRKFYVFLANHYVDIFLADFSKRYKVSVNHLHYYTYFDLNNLLYKNKRMTAESVRERRKNSFVFYSSKKNTINYVSGVKAKKIIDKFFFFKVNKNIKELKGLVVSRGDKVTGRVKIITNPEKISKMKKGDILVASMTSPDYIVVMRKAGAIITDEGGMTAHAAIVSRELGIPCICQTKIATKVLKDGDMVEVDTDKGIVKKLF